MANPSYTQEDFAFGEDDGGLGANTFDTVNTNRASQPVDTTFRLRLVVQQTNTQKDTNNDQFALYYSHNGGAWTAVPTTGAPAVLTNDANSISDNATTSQVIGDGTYSTGDLQGYDDGTTDVGTGVIDLLGGTEVEVEFCLTLPSAQVADGDTVDFQVRLLDGTSLNSYLTSPQVTVSEGAAQPQTINANTGELTASGEPATLTGTVTISTQTAELTSSGEVASVPAQPVTINTNTGELTAAGEAGSVGGGAGANVTLHTGTVQLGSGSGSVDATVTITDTTKAFLLFTVDRSQGSGTSPESSLITGEIVDATTLRFQRNNTAATEIYTIRYTVVEYDAGVTVQRGTHTMATASEDITINAVDLSKAFVLVSYRGDGTTYGDDDFCRGTLTTTTNLNLSLYNGGGTQKIAAWQVIEFDAATVQSNVLDFGTADATLTDPLTTVDPAASMLVFSYETASGTSTNMAQKTPRGSIDGDGSGVTFNRAATGQLLRLTYYVVEFTNGTVVQRASETVGANNETASVTINSVDTARSVAFAVGMAESVGDTDYTTNDDLDEGRADLYLSDATTLQINRCAYASQAIYDWQVVEFGTGGATGTQVSAQTAELTAAGETAIVTAGSAVTAQTAELTAGGETASVLPQPVTIAGVTGELTSSGELATVTPGTITITAQAGALTSSGELAAVSVGPTTIVANSGELTASGTTTTVTPGPVTVAAAAGDLTAAGELSTVIPGATTITSTTGELTAAGGNGTVSASGEILAQTAELTAGGETASVPAQPVTITGATGELTATGELATVSAGLVVRAQTAELAAAGQIAVINTGAVFVSAQIGELTATGALATVTPGAVSISAAPGELTSSGEIASVPAQPVTITTQTGELTTTGETGLVGGGSQIAAQTAELTAAGESASLTVGPTTIATQTAELAAAGETAIVTAAGAAIIAQTAELTAAGESAAIQPGPTTIAASTGELTSAAEVGTVAIPTVTINAQTGELTVSGESATLPAQPVTISAGAGALSLSGPRANVVTGGAILAQTGELTASGEPATAAVDQVTITAHVGELTVTAEPATAPTQPVTILAVPAELTVAGPTPVVLEVGAGKTTVDVSDSLLYSVAADDKLTTDVDGSDTKAYTVEITDA